MVDGVDDWHCRSHILAAFPLVSFIFFANVDWDSAGGLFPSVECSGNWFINYKMYFVWYLNFCFYLLFLCLCFEVYVYCVYSLHLIDYISVNALVHRTLIVQ